MGIQRQLQSSFAAVAGVLMLALVGCPGNQDFSHHAPAASPLGSLSDPVWQNQEANAQRSVFVVHEHEFVVDTEFLNTAGEDHLKQLAARIASGQDAQILVERSWNSARPDTEFKYRVHVNPELDMRRRDVVVRALLAMKIPDADARTVIAPDLAPQYRAGELAATDQSDFGNTNSNTGGGWGTGGGVGAGVGGFGGYAGENSNPSGDGLGSRSGGTQR